MCLMKKQNKQLIEALQIFLRYGNPKYPTHCEHDRLMICGYDKDDFSDVDIKRLEKLGFIWDEEDEYFFSFKFGSA